MFCGGDGNRTRVRSPQLSEIIDVSSLKDVPPVFLQQGSERHLGNHPQASSAAIAPRIPVMRKAGVNPVRSNTKEALCPISLPPGAAHQLRERGLRSCRALLVCTWESRVSPERASFREGQALSTPPASPGDSSAGRCDQRRRGREPAHPPGASPRPVIKKRGRYSSQLTTTSDPTISKGDSRGSGFGSPGNSTLKGSASTFVQLGSSSIMAFTQSTSGGTPPVVSS